MAFNPYADLPAHQFWRRSVARQEAFRLDPVVNPRFKVEQQECVATAGSCFAQHISRQLGRMGFNYLVTEAGEALTPGERQRRGFGTFSARFGNIYTARQLLQLFEEAFGRRIPPEVALIRPDGRWVDAFRPVIEPDGFATPDEVREARHAHLADVRTMFERADVLIFTLGLTEAWRSRDDGSVYPLAPGTAAGAMDFLRYEFVNFEVEEVVADLQAFVGSLLTLNPVVRVLLTVSPVPLIATFEPRHVLSSTTYSKAVLRVAADKLTRLFPQVDYFPSYEIITGSPTGGLYYEGDYREVNNLGVAHAMRCFARHYTRVSSEQVEQELTSSPTMSTSGHPVICDEEMIDAVGR